MNPSAEPASATTAPPRRSFVAPLVRFAIVSAYCVGIFCAGYWLYTMHNDFPIGYQPDEASKAVQLMEDFRNFNHPLLMLDVTQWLLQWRQTPMQEHAVVQTGREASAILAAVCVVGFTVAGYLSAGWAGMVLASLATLLCPSLLVYAHYMKEDPSLLCGVGLTVGAMAIVWHCRSIFLQLLGPMLAGAAAGVAASGKYVGAMAVAGALLAALFAPFRRWYWIPIRVILVAACALGSAAALNDRAIQNWDNFQHGFDKEYEHGTTEHDGVMLPTPSTFVVKVVRLETTPLIWIFAAALLLSIVTLRRGWGWDLIVVLFTVACAATLSMGAIPFHRYSLPVVVLTYFLAGLGAARCVGQLQRRPRWMIGATVGAVLLFGGLLGFRCGKVLWQFNHDSREQLIAWVKANLPPGTHLIEDSYAGLTRENSGMNVHSRSVSYAAGSGSLAMLKARGIRYVVVCDANYCRYLEPDAQGSPGRESVFDERRDWYQQLFREGKLLWHAVPDPQTYSSTYPEIRVYELK